MHNKREGMNQIEWTRHACAKCRRASATLWRATAGKARNSKFQQARGGAACAIAGAHRSDLEWTHRGHAGYAAAGRHYETAFSNSARCCSWVTAPRVPFPNPSSTQSLTCTAATPFAEAASISALLPLGAHVSGTAPAAISSRIAATATALLPSPAQHHHNTNTSSFSDIARHFVSTQRHFVSTQQSYPIYMPALSHAINLPGGIPPATRTVAPPPPPHTHTPTEDYMVGWR